MKISFFSLSDILSPSLVTFIMKLLSSVVSDTFTLRRAYFRALLSRLLRILMTASLSVETITGSSATFLISSLSFSVMAGSKRSMVSFTSALMSTFSYLNVSLLESIFWKSSSWPVRLSSRLVFCRVTFR